MDERQALKKGDKMIAASQIETKDFWTIQEASENTGRCPETIRKWIKSGILTRHECEGAVLVLKAQMRLINKVKPKRKKLKPIKQIPKDKEILTLREAEFVFGLQVKDFYELIGEGKIADHRRDGHRRNEPVLVSRSELSRFFSRSPEFPIDGMRNTTSGDIITLDEATIVTGRSKNTLRRWKREGLIRDYRAPSELSNPNAPLVLSKREILEVAEKLQRTTQEEHSTSSESVVELSKRLDALELGLEKVERGMVRVIEIAREQIKTAKEEREKNESRIAKILERLTEYDSTFVMIENAFLGAAEHLRK